MKMLRWIVAFVLLASGAFAQGIRGNGGGIAGNHSGTGCPLAGCTYTGPITTAGISDSGGINSTSGYSMSGVPFFTTVNGQPNLNVTIGTPDLSAMPSDNRTTLIYSTLTNSTATTHIWENLFSGVEIKGTGAYNGEINVVHPYFQVDAGATFAAGEGFEASMYNQGTITGGFDGVLVTFTNAAGATAHSLTGAYFQLNNANTATGSIAAWTAIIIEPMLGAGSAPAVDYAFQNNDPNGVFASLGIARFGSITTGSAPLNLSGSDNGQYTYAMEIFGLAGQTSGVPIDYFTDQGALSVGGPPNYNLFAQFVVGDAGGTSGFGSHIAVQQTTAPGITNGTLDGTASDTAGTITLTAANPVLSFHVAYHSAPHCEISSPSGTAFTFATPTTSTLSLTGGAAGNTVTYHCLQ